MFDNVTYKELFTKMNNPNKIADKAESSMGTIEHNKKESRKHYLTQCLILLCFCFHSVFEYGLSMVQEWFRNIFKLDMM